MFSNASAIANIIYIILFLATIAGGLVLFRWAMHKAYANLQHMASEIQANVIAALNAEITSLKDRIKALEQENLQLKQDFKLVRIALKKRGLTITIEDGFVSIQDEHGGSVHAQRIEEAS